MILSFTEKKTKKTKVRKEMRKLGIQVKDLFPLVPNNPTTVKMAMRINDSYYNENIIAVAETLIEEKKKEALATSDIAKQSSTTL